MMEISESKSMRGKMFSIRFTNKRHVYFLRKCVFPINYTLKQVENYLHNSLNIVKETLEILDATNVLIMDGFKRSNESTDNTLIDAYWIDAEQYIIELNYTNKVDYIILIANIDTELDAVEKYVKSEYPNSQFTIEHYDEAWIVKS